MRRHRPLTDQAGMIVVIALLVMVILTILGLSILGTSLTESQIGSNESDLRKAFFAAEAGIQEAMYRMRLDPTSFANEDPSSCSGTTDPVVIGKQGTPEPEWANPTNATKFWYYNPLNNCSSWSYTTDPGGSTPKGNFFGAYQGTPLLDTAGRTFSSTGAAHASGGLLVNANVTNTASDPRSFTVTVAPVVGFAGVCWQYVEPYVDAAGNPVPLLGSSCTPSLPSPFNPIYKVTSTGTAKNAQKVLSTMIRRFSIDPKLDGTLTANSDIHVTSASAVVDGHNYDCNGNNPSDTDSLKAAAAPPNADSQPDITVNNPGNLECVAGSGVATCGGIRTPFPSTIGALLLGPTATTTQINALNAYLESVKKTPGVDTYPENIGAPFHGILYVNGNYVQPPDGSSGILIVHNSTGTANLGNWNGGTFKGLVISDKIDKINGNAQIIGGVFGWGSAASVEVDITTGTPQLKYSKCVIDGLNQNFPFRIVPGTWHEQ